MKQIFRLLLVHLLILTANHANAITCTPEDWDEQLCTLPEYKGTRCATSAFFRTFCAAGTIGCETIPHGCIGSTPPGHWYPIVGVSGAPEWKCRCGCFAEETIFGQIDGDGITGTHVIAAQDHEEIDSLSVKSLDTLDGTSFSSRSINGLRYGPEQEPALTFKTLSGKSITVSQAHPLVISDSNHKLLAMKAASEVVVGEYLKGADGLADEIIAKEAKSYAGKMVNFNVNSDAATHHIIEADGVLAGDQGWQEQLTANTSRMMWRNDILKFLIKEEGAAQ